MELCPSTPSINHGDNKDLKTLRSVFSDEIWLMVVSNVWENGNYYRICKASSFMADIIRELRPQIVYRSVIQLLCKNWKIQSRPYQLPLVLKLRLVCQTWKRQVDSYVQSSTHHELQFVHPTNRQHYISNFVEPGCQDFCTIRDVGEFLGHFENTHLMPRKNPFVFRSVKIVVRWFDGYNLDEYQLFIDQLGSMLLDYGHHIWFLKICVHIFNAEKHVEFVPNLKRFLDCLPNLKALKVDYAGDLSMNDNHKQAVQRFVQKNPMPRLQSLRVLLIGALLKAIASSLIEQNKETIQQLDVWIHPTRPVPDLSNHPDCYAGCKAFHSFQNGISRCRLSKLDTWFSGCEWQDVFSFLENHYSSTLLELRIRESLLKPAQLKGCYLRTLKHLNLKLRKLLPMDFLLPMAGTLEDLFLEFSIEHIDYQQKLDDIDKTIKVYQFGKELHKSNIWTLLGKLNLLKIKCELEYFQYNVIECSRKNVDKVY